MYFTEKVNMDDAERICGKIAAEGVHEEKCELLPFVLSVLQKHKHTCNCGLDFQS